MGQLVIDITNNTPEQVAAALNILNGDTPVTTAPQLDAITLQLDELTSLVNAIDFHKDIKDIDQVDTNYSVELYNKAKNIFEEIITKHVWHESQVSMVKNSIFELVGDYEVRPGLSDDAYNALINKGEMIRNGFL